jgi:galacturan 1,4-alpha-galacturonidase
MFADTMDVNNIWLENFIYQGGDDCVAIKPRSYNIHIRNATCHGGNGMAIGSLGQYLEDSSVENVQISDVTIIPHDGKVGNGAYIKTWIGSLALRTAGNGAYESGGVPRGGGWGAVRNILFSNFKLNGPTHGTAITQNYGHNGSAYLPSKMQVSNVAFINFTGSVSATSTEDNVIECSTTHPCYNIAYENVLSSPGNQSSFLVENNTVWGSFHVPSN